MYTRYHNRLKELFGEDNYLNAIKNIFFIITHNDVHQKTAAEIKTRIREIDDEVEEGMVENSFLHEFLSRLRRYHYVVNYATDGPAEVFEELDGVTKGGLDAATGISAFHHLDVHENLLNQYVVLALLTWAVVESVHTAPLPFMLCRARSLRNSPHLPSPACDIVHSAHTSTGPACAQLTRSPRNLTRTLRRCVGRLSARRATSRCSSRTSQRRSAL